MPAQQRKEPLRRSAVAAKIVEWKPSYSMHAPQIDHFATKRNLRLPPLIRGKAADAQVHNELRPTLGPLPRFEYGRFPSRRRTAS